METEARTAPRNNNMVWIVVAAVVALALIVFAVLAMNGRDDADIEAPASVGAAANNVSEASADAASDAAAAARNAADSANQAARDAANATADAADRAGDRVQATIPAGDATVTVEGPAR